VPLGLDGAHGQQRLGSVERLDLRLFVDAEHQGSVGRVEVETHDVADLFHERATANRYSNLGVFPLATGSL
jgi:hypothetical protein